MRAPPPRARLAFSTVSGPDSPVFSCAMEPDGEREGPRWPLPMAIGLLGVFGAALLASGLAAQSSGLAALGLVHLGALWYLFWTVRGVDAPLGRVGGWSVAALQVLGGLLGVAIGMQRLAALSRGQAEGPVERWWDAGMWIAFASGLAMLVYSIILSRHAQAGGGPIPAGAVRGFRARAVLGLILGGALLATGMNAALTPWEGLLGLALGTGLMLSGMAVGWCMLENPTSANPIRMRLVRRMCSHDIRTWVLDVTTIESLSMAEIVATRALFIFWVSGWPHGSPE